MLQKLVQRISNSTEISKHNKEISSKFLAQLRLEGIGTAKISRYLQELIKFNRLLGKDFDEADKEDIKRVVGEIQASNLAENTKRGFKIMLRKLYRCIERIDERGVYPERVKWMKLDLKANHKKLPEILTDNEIKAIIEHCGNLRDKALVSVLAESGCRVSEVGTLQIKNASFDSGKFNGHKKKEYSCPCHCNLGKSWNFLFYSISPFMLDIVNCLHDLGC